MNKSCWGCCGLPYKSDIEAESCENRIYHSDFHKHDATVLTDDGVLVIDAITCEYIKTIPNDDRMVILLRKAIVLWANGDIDNFISLTNEWYEAYNLDKFTIEEGWVFKYTNFQPPPNIDNSVKKYTCISWILEDIDEDSYVESSIPQLYHEAS